MCFRDVSFMPKLRLCGTEKRQGRVGSFFKGVVFVGKPWTSRSWLRFLGVLPLTVSRALRYFKSFQWKSHGVFGPVGELSGKGQHKKTRPQKRNYDGLMWGKFSCSRKGQKLAANKPY